MTLKPIFHGGIEVSIAHLAPMTLACPCPQIKRDLVIEVDFRNHCYTEKFDPGKHEQEQIILYDAPGRPRVFCPIRHGLSVRLPEIVSQLPNSQVFQTTQRRNYVFVTTLNISNQHYEIYFMIQRAESVHGIDLRLTVESAYPVITPSPMPKRPRKIWFGILALKVLKRQQIKFG